MIYILFGEDQNRQEYKLETIKKSLEYDQMERIDAMQVPMASALEILDSYSLFAAQSLVVIENASFLSARNMTKYDASEIAKRDPDDKIIVYMTSAAKLDQRKKAVKELMAKAKVIECQPLDEKSMMPVLKEMLSEKGISMDVKAMEWMVSHAGFNCLQISSELDKLQLYKPEGQISLEDVQNLVTIEPVQNVFKMTDALFSRQGMRLLALYRNFRKQNMEPAAINALLASQIRFIYQVRVCMDMGMNQQEIARKLNASSGRIYNSMKNASRFSASQLLGHLHDLSRLDVQMKSGMIDKDEGFEKFILEMIVDQKI